MLAKDLYAGLTAVDERMQRPWVMLATATIVPNVFTDSKRSEPAQRLEDYTTAMQFWAGNTDLPIVFCENSGHDLGSFASLGSGRSNPIEVLSFTAPVIPPEKGKGYGESLIIRHALDHSKLIGPKTTVIKMTGRLIVPNFARLLAQVQRLDFDVCLDLRASLDYSDCRVFAAKVPFLRDYLLPESELIDETTYYAQADGTTRPIMNLERVLAHATLRAITDGLKYELLPVDPRFLGYSGSYNYRYSNTRSPIRQVVKTMRRIARALEWHGYPATRPTQSNRYMS